MELLHRELAEHLKGVFAGTENAAALLSKAAMIVEAAPQVTVVNLVQASTSNHT